MNRWRLLLFLGLLACPTPPALDAGVIVPDAGEDAGRPDAGSDAGVTDGGRDAGLDAGPGCPPECESCVAGTCNVRCLPGGDGGC